jgi:protein-disulfide isomerase
MHQYAAGAALASMAAHEQGKFWEYHDKLFANQQKLAKDNLLQYARELKLDMNKFQAAVDTSKFKAAVDADSNEAQGLGVTGTPAFFVNGHFLSGAQPYENFVKAINAELTKLKLPIPPAANAGG